MKTWVKIVFPLVILGLALAAYTQLKPKPIVVHANKSQQVIKAPTNATLLDSVNKERAKYGVAPLTEDSRLDESAQLKCNDENERGYTEHIDPVTGKRGLDYAKEAFNNENAWFGENLTQATPFSTDQAMRNWINSEQHHQAMIATHFTATGFGICGNEVVEHFYGPNL